MKYYEHRIVIFLGALVLSTCANLAQGGGAEKPKPVVKSPSNPNPIFRRRPAYTRRPSSTSTQSTAQLPNPTVSVPAPTNDTTSPSTSPAASETGVGGNSANSASRVTVSPNSDPTASKIAFVNTELLKDAMSGYVSTNATSQEGAAKIAQSINEFAKQHDVQMTFDLAQMNSSVLTYADQTDITNAFIATYNRKYGNSTGVVPEIAVTGGRVALIDTERFGDANGGISRLVAAYKQVDAEFKPAADHLRLLQAQMKTMSGNERDALQKQYDQEFKTAQENFNRRVGEVTGPINEDIGRALDMLARQNGITTIFDASKLGSAILTSSSASDLTASFIAAYNSGGSAAAMSIPAVNIPNLKIAYVDTSAFTDYSQGIARYTRAIKALEVEFKPRSDELNAINNRLKALSEEISKLGGSSDPRVRQPKVDEAEKLQRDFKYKQEQAQADYQKRSNDVVGPIIVEVGKALELFATQHGLTLVINTSDFASALITSSPSVDVTREFINGYNARNP